MAKESDKKQRELVVVRDTVESIWVAIVLAFVLRAFAFEAFVIPTGSMAPRLMGAHYRLQCPCCGREFTYGAPDEDRRGRLGDSTAEAPINNPACPNCGFLYNHANIGPKVYPSGGDRVLVLKYIYHFSPPRPWDVVVFKNPQDNSQNYIKRLVGLPGQLLEVIDGDIYFRQGSDRNGDGVIDREDFDFNGDGELTSEDLADPEGLKAAPYRIRRKQRLEIQEAMWQVVFDNDYQPNMEMIAELNRDRPRWRRLAPPAWRAASGDWDLSGDGGRRFAYRHAAGPGEVRLEADREAFSVRYGYNPPGGREAESYRRSGYAYICQDTLLSTTYTPRDASSKVSLVTTSSECGRSHAFRAEVRADGEVTLWHRPPGGDGPGEEVRWASRRIDPFKPGRPCKLALAQVDYKVTLWIEDRPIVWSTDEQYSPDPVALKEYLRETDERLEKINRLIREFNGTGFRASESRPEALVEHLKHRAELLESRHPTPKLRILADGGPCELTHVRVGRAVYYTFQRLSPSGGSADTGALMDYARKLGVEVGEPGWGTTGNPIVPKKHFGNPDLDEFFVLGDNSPQSHDGRGWIEAAPTLRLWQKDGRVLDGYAKGAEPLYTLGTVPRYSMIGRALFVYWPSGFRVPGLPQLPLIPNVGKMRLIR